jgi:hypothetical protein
VCGNQKAKGKGQRKRHPDQIESLVASWGLRAAGRQWRRRGARSAGRDAAEDQPSCQLPSRRNTEERGGRRWAMGAFCGPPRYVVYILHFLAASSKGAVRTQDSKLQDAPFRFGFWTLDQDQRIPTGSGCLFGHHISYAICDMRYAVGQGQDRGHGT